MSIVMQAELIKVRNLGLKYCGINLVSTTKDKKYGNAQREVKLAYSYLSVNKIAQKSKSTKFLSTFPLSFQIIIVFLQKFKGK